jgi:hypothetical protein
MYARTNKKVLDKPEHEARPGMAEGILSSATLVTAAGISIPKADDKYNTQMLWDQANGRAIGFIIEYLNDTWRWKLEGKQYTHEIWKSLWDTFAKKKLLKTQEPFNQLCDYKIDVNLQIASQITKMEVLKEAYTSFGGELSNSAFKSFVIRALPTSMTTLIQNVLSSTTGFDDITIDTLVERIDEQQNLGKLLGNRGG